MIKSPELEALSAQDEAEVISINTPRNQRITIAIFILTCLAMSWFVIRKPTEKTQTLHGEEEFNTTSFRPPSFVREKVQQTSVDEPPIINIPPPPPDPSQAAVPEPAEVSQTAPSAPAPPAVEEFPQRYKSKLIEMDQVQSRQSPEERGAEGAQTVSGADKNSKFLASASATADRKAEANIIPRIDATVPEGTLIPGILETSVVSDLPGQVRAITSEDVYSFDGRRILIPSGTRLIGEYQSEVMTGQTRVFVVWTRLLRDDGVSIRLNSIGSDSLGRSGLTGHIDKKWRERFGASIMLSVVGAGASYLTSLGNGERVGDENDRAIKNEELARETIAGTYSQMANTALRENLRIKPTISIKQGERIFIFVRQDLDFSAFYEDPVEEATKEIKRELRRK